MLNPLNFPQSLPAIVENISRQLSHELNGENVRACFGAFAQVEDDFDVFSQSLQASVFQLARNAQQFKVTLKSEAEESEVLKVQLEELVATVAEVTFPFPALTGQWLKDLSLAYMLSPEETPTVEQAWQLARINYQRACERILLFHVLLALNHQLTPASTTSQSRRNRELRILRVLFHQEQRRRLTLYKFALLQGLEAQQEIARIVEAELDKYSIIEYLQTDERSPGSYRGSTEETFRDALQTAVNNLTSKAP